MAKIKLTLSDKVCNGKSEVLVRFYHSYFNERAKSGIFVIRERWDKDAERLTIPRYKDNVANECVKANAELDTLKNTILEAFTATNGVLPKKWLQSVISGQKTQEKPLFYVSELIKAYADRANAYTTKIGFRTLYNRFVGFGDLPVAGITSRDLELYEKYLTARVSPNTISTDMRRLRAVILWAFKNGYTTQRPYDTYKLPPELYGTPTYLTLEERDKIAQTDYNNARLNNMRDLFVFQCHVGCRVSDLLNITIDSVRGDFLEYIAKKTETIKPTTVRVPLTATAKEILQRHNGLPKISAQKYNYAIKDLVRLSGIERVVTILDKHTGEPTNAQLWEVSTSHIARRTFMANLFKQTKSERLVISMTGHSEGSKSLARYTLVDDEMKKQVIAGIDTKNGN